jgi:hypothetical protein
MEQLHLLAVLLIAVTLSFTFFVFGALDDDGLADIRQRREKFGLCRICWLFTSTD